jgi:superfamily II DNA or RNA helicase
MNRCNVFPMTKEEQNKPTLSDDERLELQQLQLAQWYQARQPTKQNRRLPERLTEASDERQGFPDRWDLLGNADLYSWQIDCVQEWFRAGCRGTVKVVTGGGKTVVALAIAQELQHNRDHELRLAIVVPTVVLMNQWYEELERRSNLPEWAIGRMGGGFEDSFAGNRCILICVLASAYKFLPSLVDETIGNHLLLIADECHRAGATKMSKVLRVRRAYVLGLSATPERNDEEEQGEGDRYDDSQLGRELGGVVYELTLAQAVELGIVPKFTIHHYGLPLDGEEGQKYERLTRAIEDARKELQHCGSSSKGSILAFYRWARAVSEKKGSRANRTAARFILDTRERKELLYRIKARHLAVEILLRSELEAQPDSRAILFHESIDAVMQLFNRLRQLRFRVVAEHSDLPDSYRDQSLDLFRRGVANVIVSAKSLIEGFNVPAADVGIIVASSSSVRQRIQSLGRVLRRHRGPGGEEKTSVIHVLYARGTVDEAIYARADWNEFTGADRNLYFVWNPPGKPQHVEEPPRKPLPRDIEVDQSELRPGSEYPGQYEGVEYSTDTQNNVRDAVGRYVRNPGSVPEAVRAVKGSAGRFRVTPNRGYVLVRVPADIDEWVTRFVMRLEHPFESTEHQVARNTADWSTHAAWVESAQAGAEYPFTDTESKLKLNYRQRRGGVIARRVPQGEVYARVGAAAADPAKGEDAARLLEACRKLQMQGLLSSQFEINAMNDAVCRSAGRVLFLSTVRNGLEFPQLGELGA